VAKTFFDLPAPYGEAVNGPDGKPISLRVRRLEHSGRLGLYQIINDPPPYWFVTIKSFEPMGRDSVLISKKLAHPHKIGTWRFVDLASAKAKFEQLKPYFPAVKRETNPAVLEALAKGRAALQKLRDARTAPKIP
jgi:hypothetical protein